MSSLPVVDIAIILIYLLAMVGIGMYFSRRNKNTEQFTKASGRIWAAKNNANDFGGVVNV